MEQNSVASEQQDNTKLQEMLAQGWASNWVRTSKWYISLGQSIALLETESADANA